MVDQRQVILEALVDFDEIIRQGEANAEGMCNFGFPVAQDRCRILCLTSTRAARASSPPPSSAGYGKPSLLSRCDLRLLGGVCGEMAARDFVLSRGLVPLLQSRAAGVDDDINIGTNFWLVHQVS